ncbi:hypothetical protein AB0C96_14870 [Streptomyces sp. NPDC048506]|uniref:hypothetical protein n=1 Tax=Streptomyces sp. NPDC048506 TaxID=3155028 RepID=UPI00343C803C
MNPAPRGHAPARSIRRAYVVAGAVMALMWVGEGNEPAWAHALRATFVLLVLPPLLLRTDRHLTTAFHTSARPGPALTRLIGARVLIVSASLVGSALVGHLLDPHIAFDARALGIRLSLVLLTVPLQIRAARRARAGGVHPATRPTLSAPRLICAKLGLIAAALLAQTLLNPYVANAQLLVAAGIVLTVAALGPTIHPRLLVTHPTPAPREPSPARTAA